ncbi:MAG: helicase HerA-like domain-containing protein, partial [Thiothrix litoralis]
IDTAETIMQMGVGEALVSVLDDKGIPGIVQHVLISPPHSRIGPLTDTERADLLRTSPFAGRYDTMINRESAYELLQKRAETAAAEQEAQMAAQKATRTSNSRAPREPESLLGSLGEAFVKNAVKAATSSAGRRIGTQIVRGILGSLFKGR